MGVLPRFCFRRVDSPLLVSYYSDRAAIMMRDLFVLCLVPLAVLSTPMPYKDDGYDKEYKGDSYDGDSYTKDDGYGKSSSASRSTTQSTRSTARATTIASAAPRTRRSARMSPPALRRRPDQPAEAQVLRG